jgi:hypothetical protein
MPSSKHGVDAPTAERQPVLEQNLDIGKASIN